MWYAPTWGESGDLGIGRTFETTRPKPLPIDDQAEQEVLWRVEGGLESVLVEPLRPDYREQVEAAKKRIRERG